MTDTTPPDSLPLIDARDALARAGDRPEVALELFELLRQSGPEAAREIQAAQVRDDLDGLRETAHRLLGATQYCGVPRLRAQVAEVEQLCLQGDRERLAGAVPRLLASLDAVGRHRDPLDPAATERD